MEVSLEPIEVRRLLDELCVGLGFCLPPADQDRLEADPPTDENAFTDAVFVAERMWPCTDLRLWRSMRECVLRHFVRAVEKRDS